MGEISDGVIDTIVPEPPVADVPRSHRTPVGRRGKPHWRDETAFNHRTVEYSFMSIGQCADPSEAEVCMRWAREFWEAMQPYSTGGAYVIYLGQEVDEGTDRVKGYGPEKYQRLLALRRKYDLANMFRLNQNVRPG